MPNASQDIVERLDITPSRAAAFGAAVGALFALMVLDLPGARAELAAWVSPWLFVVGAQVVGAAIAGAKAGSQNLWRG